MTKGKLYDGIIPYEDDDIIEIIGAILDVIKEAKEEFPNPAEFPYETSVEARDELYHLWFKKWFGEGKNE